MAKAYEHLLEYEYVLKQLHGKLHTLGPHLPLAPIRQQSLYCSGCWQKSDYRNDVGGKLSHLEFSLQATETSS